MARPRQAVDNAKSSVSYDSIGLKACRYCVAIDKEIIDTIEKKEHLTEADVHDIRVILKRLRAMRQLTYFETGYPHFRTADRNLRDAGRLLSADRDQTVLRKTLKKLLNGTDSEEEQEKEKVQTVLSHVVSSDGKGIADESKYQVREFVLQDQRDWRKFQKDLAQTDNVMTGLARTYDHARSLAIRVSRNDKPVLSHRWRKWSKYLYYQLQFLSQINPNSAGKSQRELDLKRLGNVLGWRHDVEVLNQVLSQSSELASAKEEIKLVKTLAREWDRELKEESELLSKELYTLAPLNFAESVLGDSKPQYSN